jgi:hypothetical protein
MAAERQPRVAGNEGEPMKALAVMVFGVCVSACGADPVDDPGSDNGAVVDLSSHEQVLGDWVIEGRDPVPDAPPGAPSDGAVPPVGCMVVQSCDAPGTDGTRCVWTGCSLPDALAECAREAPRQCPRIVCPFMFVGPGGKRFRNGTCF